MQDTPAVKMPYQAYVTVANKGYVVKMSANSTGSVVSADTKWKTYSFKMNLPIPSYLIAFSIGNIVENPVGKGNRTFIISEPDNVKRDLSELDELDELLDDVEAYVNPPNPYEWGTYALIVQPPSFPIGGMENPLLTFASPTIIVGDKSQIYVATHEIGHSWTGNQVTCRDWSNFWVNEGFTVFLERKISGQRNGLEFALIESQLGNASLWSDVMGYGINNSYSSLYPDLNDGANADDSSSEIPYEKGYQFLYYLENKVMKTQKDFQDMLGYYINKYRGQSVTYLEFRLTFNEWIRSHYSASDAETAINKVDWNTWVLTPGGSPVQLDFNTPSGQLFESIAADYVARQGDSSAANYTDYMNTKNPNLKVVFLNKLTDLSDQVTYKTLAKIDKDLNVTHDLNPEIGQRWYPLAIQEDF
jgi:leukotriene-A4 hydrolase